MFQGYLTSSYLPSQYFLFCRRLRYILSRTGGRVADLEKIKSAPHCHKLFINHSFSHITIVTIYSPYNCHNRSPQSVTNRPIRFFIIGHAALMTLDRCEMRTTRADCDGNRGGSNSNSSGSLGTDSSSGGNSS